MKITIDDDIVRSMSTPDGAKLTFPEVLAILLCSTTDNAHDVIEDLYDRGILVHDTSTLYTRIKPFRKYFELVQRILLASDKSVPDKDELTLLASRLKEVYPKGRKTDTVPWQESISATVDRLRGLYKHFPEINEYTHDDIINATKKYVELFQYDNTYMRTLNYFLWKRIETLSSDLLKMLENPDSKASDFYDSSELI